MSGMSRRDLLRASAGAAAVAVPMSALSVGGVAAAEGLADYTALTETGARPVVFSIKNPAKGEVSVLQGTNEVVVRDRQLVARIMRAANSRRAL